MKSLACFKALADQTRLRLYHILMHHELSVGEMVSLLEMGQSRISRHLKILTDCGLLVCRRDGVWAFYSAEKGDKTHAVASMVASLDKGDSQVRADLRKAEAALQDRREKRRHFFNEIAPTWDLLKADIIGTFDLNGAFMERISSCRKSVDLGCGTGALMGQMADRVSEVVGVDSSPNMLKEAASRLKKLPGVFDLRLGELEHLPMGDAEVDLAIISLALHHLDKPELAVKESARVVASGGRLLVAEFERHKDESLRDRFGDRWLGFSVEELIQWMQSAGFGDVRFERFPVPNGPGLLLFECCRQES